MTVHLCEKPFASWNVVQTTVGNTQTTTKKLFKWFKTLKKCFKFGCKKVHQIKIVPYLSSFLQIVKPGVGQGSATPCSLNKYKWEKKKSVHSVKYELFTLYSGTLKDDKKGGLSATELLTVKAMWSVLLTASVKLIWKNTFTGARWTLCIQLSFKLNFENTLQINYLHNKCIKHMSNKNINSVLWCQAKFFQRIVYYLS